MSSPRLSPQTLIVLEQFLLRPRSWRYGYDLSRDTSLKSGTLYPILMRLARHRLLETKWVSTDDGVPPRHTYRLTPKGAEFARLALSPKPSSARARRVALSGGSA